jgi:hypothetical protein
MTRVGCFSGMQGGLGRGWNKLKNVGARVKNAGCQHQEPLTPRSSSSGSPPPGAQLAGHSPLAIQSTSAASRLSEQSIHANESGAPPASAPGKNLPDSTLRASAPMWRSDRWAVGIRDTAKYVQDSRDKLFTLLPEKERLALQDYLDHGYALDNQLIRGGVHSADQYKTIINTLVRGGLGVDAPLFRGLSDHTLINAGGKYVDPAPGSASVNMNRALQLASQGKRDGGVGICLHILGAKAANVSGASKLGRRRQPDHRPE